ncbi:MAG TPA: response regulator transcription factor [Terriglobia bacterium]|nr:response regulator transcription factor [Terriglobia bacterium]
MRILVAEDDRPVASFLKKGLEAEHYAVDLVPDGQEALYMAEEYDYDLVLLDLVLPKMDGLQVLRQIRNRKKNLPVLVLTGRARVEDRVKGLDLGADDYMVKPFAFRELTARVRALLRRGDGTVDFKLQVDDLQLNLVERSVRRGERKIELTPKEFALLEYLMRNQGRSVSRPMIIEHVWNFTFDTMTNVVDVYINYLRKKVDEGEARKLIYTVRGVGYRIGSPES